MSEKLLQTHIQDRVAILRLQGPAGNAINEALLDALEQAVAWANQQPRVQAALLAGSREHFSSGADLRIFRRIEGPDDARAVSRRFQQALQVVEDSALPIVAALSGRVLGCALEVALACHYRVCADSARLGSPEVRFGINPGAGATQRLPRLIGIEQALKMMLGGKAISAAEALELGLVDQVCRAEELLEAALAAARGAAARRQTSRLVPQPVEPAAREQLFRRADRQIESVPAEIVAPREIVSLVRLGVEQSVEAGLRGEQDAFAKPPASEQSSGKEEAVRRAAVVGLGTMGQGIARAFAAAGVDVLAVERDQAALQGALEKLKQNLQRSVQAGRMQPEKAQALLGRIVPIADWGQLSGAEVAVEAVFEDATLKREVIGRLEEVLDARALIATNTSTLSLDVLGQDMRRPERLVGLHFFNPAHRMPLVEVIRHAKLAPGVLGRAVSLVRRLGKTPVVAGNREGFVVNRIFIPYLKEAFWLVEEGVDPQVVDQAVTRFGFPMGPISLADMAGLDILARTDEVLRRAFPRHGALSSIVDRLVGAGHLGQKSGAGVYKYRPGDYTPLPHPAARQIIASVRSESSVAGVASPSLRQIARRLVLRMVVEAFWVLAEGVARRGCEIDAAMVLGTGFPDYRGGPMQFAVQMGRERLLAELEQLRAAHGERFLPPKWVHGLEDLEDVVHTGT